MIYCGDALTILQTLPSESVHCCITSPPYYNLRDYGIDGQIGREPTPEAYIDRLVAVFREVRRVLRADGTLWLNIGDSYATRSGNQPPQNTRNTYGHTAKSIPSGYKAKDLMGIPWMLAFALRADGWYLRQDIIWSKPNAMPESVKDRCTKAHEYIFLLSKSEHYYFNAEAIREPVADSSVIRALGKSTPVFGGRKYGNNTDEKNRTKSGNPYILMASRNKRDVWNIATQPYKGAHFAVFPAELVRPCIRAGCPSGGIVIDPFLGSGTTALVALQEGREIIGIDISPDYCRMAEDRIAPFLAQMKLEE